MCLIVLIECIHFECSRLQLTKLFVSVYSSEHLFQGWFLYFVIKYELPRPDVEHHFSLYCDVFPLESPGISIEVCIWMFISAFVCIYLLLEKFMEALVNIKAITDTDRVQIAL